MSDVRQIVVSLPKKNGHAIKDALKNVAESDNRSLSNQVCIILMDWIESNGYWPEDFDEHDGHDEPNENLDHGTNEGSATFP